MGRVAADVAVGGGVCREPAFTEAYREHVGCAGTWAGVGLRRCLRHLNTRLLGLEMRYYRFAEEAQGVQHLLVLRRPDGA
jgi:hypothetical protein